MSNLPFEHEVQGFNLRIDEEPSTHYDYPVASLTLPKGLKGDRVFFRLLSHSPAVIPTSLQGNNDKKYSFLVVDTLRTTYQPKWFAVEVAHFVAQLKERAMWRRRSKPTFILQLKYGKPTEAYITIRSVSAQDAKTRLEEAIHSVAPDILTIRSLPLYISSTETDHTFLIALPAATSKKVVQAFEHNL